MASNNVSKAGPSQNATSKLNVQQQQEEYVIIAPDGGWGWVVVFAAFYCNAVIDGIIFTFGMYLQQIVEQYNANHASVAFVGSLMFGLHMAAGPLCAVLTKSFGIRPVVVFGSLVTAGVLASAYINPPFPVFTVLFGVVSGIAMCFVYMNSITVTAIYFSRLRILAVGLVVCGTGFGTVVFAQASNFMLNTMTWQEAHLVLAGCALLMAVAGFTFRPLQPVAIVSSQSVPPGEIQSMASLMSLPSVGNEEPLVVLMEKRTMSLNSALDATSAMLEAVAAEMTRTRRRDIFALFCSRIFGCCCPVCCMKGDVAVMNPQTKADLIKGRGMAEDVRATTVPPIVGSRWSRMKRLFIDMDWGIMKMPSFLLFSLSGAFSVTAIIMFFFFESDRIMHKGHSRDVATLMISTVGGANMVWRIALGLVTVIPQVNYHYVNIVCHLAGGAAVIASVYVESLEWQHVLGVIFGAGLGAYAVFRPVLLLEIVGLERLTNAMGIWFFLTGTFSILGPPLGGYLFTLTGNNDATYILTGSLFIISALMMMCMGGSNQPSQRRTGAASPPIV